MPEPAPQVARAPLPPSPPPPPPAPAAPPAVQEQDIADEVAEIERVLKGASRAQPQAVDHEKEIAEELAAIERALQASEAAASKPAVRKRRLLRVGMAGSVLLFAALLAGTVHWYQRESKMDDTMAAIATGAAQAPAPTRVAALPPAPEVRDAVAAPPPMVMLQQTPAAAPVEPPVPAATVTPVATPTPAPTPAPPAAEPAQVKPQAPAEPAAPVAKPRRKEVVAKAADPEEAPRPRKPRPQPAALPDEPKLTRDQQMEETLRLCRAAGYHTTQCLEKRCQATRYGLACRG